MIRTISLALFTASVALSAPVAFGAGMSIAEIQGTAKLAVEKFVADHADHAEHFVGYKVWKSGDESKVKVYVNHDGMAMEYNYNCHKHDDGELECHDQGR